MRSLRPWNAYCCVGEADHATGGRSEGIRRDAVTDSRSVFRLPWSDRRGRGAAACSGFIRGVLFREKLFNKRKTNKKVATTCKKHDHNAMQMITCKSILTKDKGKHLAILFISLEKAIKDVVNDHSSC